MKNKTQTANRVAPSANVDRDSGKTAHYESCKRAAFLPA